MISTSFRILRLNLSGSHVYAVHLLTDSLSLNSATTRQWLVSQSAALEDRMASIIGNRLLFIKMWSMWLWVFPSQEVQSIYKCFDKETLWSWHSDFLCGKADCSNTIMFTILMLIHPITSLKKIFTPHFSIKVVNTSSISSQKSSFSSLLLSSDRACLFRTIISHQQPLGTMYDVLYLRNSTLLTGHMTLWYKKKNLYLINNSHFYTKYISKSFNTQTNSPENPTSQHDMH